MGFGSAWLLNIVATVCVYLSSCMCMCILVYCVVWIYGPKPYTIRARLMQALQGVCQALSVVLRAERVEGQRRGIGGA